MSVSGRVQGRMSTVILYDTTGTTLIATVAYPDFQQRPSVIVWTDRFFIWNGAMQKWIEGWAWFV